MKIPEPVKPGDMAVKISRAWCKNMEQWAGETSGFGLGQVVYVEKYARDCNCCVSVTTPDGKSWGTCISTLLKISPDADTEDMETESPEKVRA